MKHFLTESARVLVPLIILAAGIGGFLVFGQKPKVVQREVSTDNAALVESIEVKTLEETFDIEVEGVAVPFRRITLSAEVDGRITNKSPISKAGSYVELNDPLFQIDPSDYKLEVMRLESQLRQATEEIAAVDVDIANTQSMVKLANEELAIRAKDLKRRTQLATRNAISDSEVDDAKRMELSARNSLQTLHNQINVSRQRKKTLDAARELVAVQLKRAELDLSRATVTSPVIGTVIQDHVEQNDYVKKGDTLVTIHETERMEVKCSLRVEELYWVWLQSGIFAPNADVAAVNKFEIPQTPVSVVYEFQGTDYVWDGVLSRYEGTGLDDRTRMVPCRVRVDEPTKPRTSGTRSEQASVSLPSLITGMYVTIRIPIAAPVELIEIPTSALRPGGEVWVIRDRQLHIQTVEVAHANDPFVLVRRQQTGLQPGDKVITSPLAIVKNGMSVKELSAQ